MRALVSRVFTPKAVADLEPMIRGLVRKYLDPLDGDEMDLVADFSGPFPVEVISVMLGVPEPDRQQIRHWTDEMLTREPGNPKPTPQGMEAGLNLGIYIHGLAAEKRRRPTDDMISRLCRGRAERRRGRRLLPAARRRRERDRHQAHRRRRGALRPQSRPVAEGHRRPRAARPGGRGDPAVLGAVAVPGSMQHGGDRVARRHDPGERAGAAASPGPRTATSAPTRIPTASTSSDR